MVSSQAGYYTAVPTSETCSTAGPSRSGSVSSSPLQHSNATLTAADQPYELSEKAHWGIEIHPQAQQQRAALRDGKSSGRQGAAAALVGSAVEWLQRAKTIILVSVCLLLAMMVLLQGSSRVPASSAQAKVTNPATNHQTAAAAPAAAYRLEDDMVLITKVGSATVHKRLLIHLAEQPLSHLYMPNRLYVSDYPLTINNITFFDALSNVSSTISSLDEFKSLRGELKALVESNQNLDDMSSKDGGWKLDKYKFLPMVAEAWRRFPRKKWYVVVEADTFLFWNELVKWLEHMDESKQYMFGHPTFCDYDGQSTMFTHGGSGIVLSQALMEASFGQDPDFEHNHDDLIQKSAFGDALLSKSIYDSPGVNITELSREGGDKFNSDPPRVLKFHRGNWCSPIMSVHHVTPSDTAHLYDFQRRIEPKLAAQDLIRWGDVWDEFIPQFLREAMEQVGRFDADTQLSAASAEPGEVGVIGWQAIEDWDSETTDLTTENANECQKRCRSDQACIMWEFREHGEQDWGGGRRRRSGESERRANGGKCRYTSEFLRIGVTKPSQAGLTTGWMGSRIDRWRKELECSGRTGLNAYRD